MKAPAQCSWLYCAKDVRWLEKVVFGCRYDGPVSVTRHVYSEFDRERFMKERPSRPIEPILSVIVRVFYIRLRFAG